MRASTPDTVIIISSDDEKEDEAKEVVNAYFQDSVGRPAVGEELMDLARYTVRHPSVISAANESHQREVITRQGRGSRGQAAREPPRGSSGQSPSPPSDAGDEARPGEG